MNFERFKLPVLVAAGLHGALFLYAPPTKVVTDGRGTVDGAPPVPPPPTEIYEVPLDDPPEPASGGGVPRPGIPEVPPPEALRGDEITVPVEVATTFDTKVVKLTEVPVGPAGPGTGPVIGPGGPGVPRTIDWTKLDRAPRTVRQIAPRYPEAMSRAHVDGTVTVAFVVDPEGRVVSAEATSWTNRAFVDPAVEAVRTWRFEPGTVGGRRVRFRMAVPIEFRVTE